MLSQLAYVGSVVMPEPEQIDAIQSLITNFVKGKMRIAKDSLFTSTEKGGLSLIDLKQFFVGLHCSWIKRCYNNQIDCWRYDLNKKCGSNVLTAAPTLFEQNLNPVLFNLCKFVMTFKLSFYKINDNFWTAYLIGNPMLVNNRQDKEIFDISFLVDGNNPNHSVFGLKIGDFLTVQGDFKDLHNVNEILGRAITNQQYQSFKLAVNESLFLARKNRVLLDNSANCLDNFITRFKKGSRPFRRVLNLVDGAKVQCKNKTSTKTFFRLINTEMVHEIELKKCYKQWCYGFLPNKVREFCFKFRHNILGLNTRVWHFNRN
jgi:hypothetical protein